MSKNGGITGASKRGARGLRGCLALFGVTIRSFDARGCVFLLLCILLPVYSQAEETVVAKVFLNTAEKGDFFFVMTLEGVPLFRPEDLKGMGLKEMPKGAAVMVDGKEYIPLSSFYPAVDYEMDEKEAVLHITADPGLFKKNIVDLAYKRAAAVEYVSNNAAFLNYSLTYNMDEDFDFTTLSLPWEFGVNVKEFFGFSSFSYTKNVNDDNFVRLMSNITKDDEGRLRRYVLGDFFSFSGELGGGAILGGLSIFKNFSINPYLLSYSALDLSGVVNTPSDVEVYINDMLIRTEHLAPGEFEFRNIASITGSVDATLVIKDAYGREERIERPFYLSTLLLKKGLHDYSYNLGFKREALGQESFDYGDLTFLGFHRYGFTDSLTAGFRAEGDRDVANVGPQAQFLFGRLGEVTTSLAFSHEDGEYGYGGALSYFYAGKGLSTRFSVRGFSREYSNLNIGASQDKSRLEWLVGLGFSQRFMGSFSATYSRIERFLGTHTKRASLFYSRRLLWGISLNASVSRTETDVVNDELFVSLNRFFGGDKTGNLYYQVQDDRSTETISLDKNPPLGTGLSYRLLAERREDHLGEREIDGNAFAQYRAPFGIYSADYRRIAGHDSYSLSVSGGLAFINSSPHLTRPIMDSFALVKVGDLKGVKVNYNNQEVGRTNRNGEVLVPELISYYDNDLSIDSTDFPVNYEIPEVTRYISTPFRGAGVVSFDVRKLQSFVGYFYFMEKGEKRPAEYAGIEIKVDDRVVDAQIGVGGEFYLENLPSGRLPARLFLKEKECNFDIIIPDSDQMVVDMGEVTCEVD